jgi:hypothetical protein
MWPSGKASCITASFSKLRDVVAFYATRDTNPERWYKSGTFDDIPTKYRDNVNVDKAPYNRRRGGTPALDDQEIDAIVAFLGTLTDAHSSDDPTGAIHIQSYEIRILISVNRSLARFQWPGISHAKPGSFFRQYAALRVATRGRRGAFSGHDC